MNFTTYLETVYEALREVELLIDRANDLVKYRIENILIEMSTVPLSELPTETPWTIDEFVKRTEVSQDFIFSVKSLIFVTQYRVSRKNFAPFVWLL